MRYVIRGGILGPHRTTRPVLFNRDQGGRLHERRANAKTNDDHQCVSGSQIPPLHTPLCLHMNNELQVHQLTCLLMALYELLNWFEKTESSCILVMLKCQ